MVECFWDMLRLQDTSWSPCILSFPAIADGVDASCWVLKRKLVITLFDVLYDMCRIMAQKSIDLKLCISHGDPRETLEWCGLPHEESVLLPEICEATCRSSADTAERPFKFMKLITACSWWVHDLALTSANVQLLWWLQQEWIQVFDYHTSVMLVRRCIAKAAMLYCASASSWAWSMPPASDHVAC